MSNKLSIGFLWHLHQPEYRDPVTGDATLPWVRLHSCMGYSDMIALAYRYPEVGQVLNLTPVLLDQLQAIAQNTTSDLYLELSKLPPDSLSETQKQFIVKNFFQANANTQIKQFPRYYELWLRQQNSNASINQFSNRDIRDIQVLFNLSWMGWSARKLDPVIELITRQTDYTEDDKQILLDLQIELTLNVLEQLSKVEQDTKSELTFTPFYHPIAPLLCDSNASLVSRPDMPLPNARFQHPEDTVWHVREGMRKLEEITGHKPKGMWPAEGSVSPQAAEIFAQAGVQWLVTDEGNVYASDPPINERYDIHRPHRLQNLPDAPTLLFRERDISDAIGFRYQKMTPDEATDQLIARFLQAADHVPNPSEFMLTIALDGENPWGYFPDYGEGFQCRLMERLRNHPRLAIQTMSAYLETNPPIRTIHRLHSGSWIDSDFHIWIGDPFKNHAWELLTQTRSIITARNGANIPDDVWKHMHIAEGSDWFWWYGQPNNSDTDDEFDRLYRGHLQQVYRLLGLPIPSELFDPIGQPAAEWSMQPTHHIRPELDGMATTYFEWLGSGYIDRSGELTHSESNFWIERLHYGFDSDNLYIRVDFNKSAQAAINSGMSLSLVIVEPKQVVWRLAGELLVCELIGQCVHDQILEASIPLSAINVQPNMPVALHVRLESNAISERFPSSGGDVRFRVLDSDEVRKDWSV